MWQLLYILRGVAQSSNNSFDQNNKYSNQRWSAAKTNRPSGHPFMEDDSMSLNHKSFLVGIVGAGDVVTTVHLPVLLAMEEVSVAWLADVNSSRANSVARAFGVNHCELPNNLTGLPYTDVVLLAIPYGVREPYYCALRERSSAVYVEKPFSRSIEHHRRICSWFPDYNLACGLQKRSSGPTLIVQQLVKEDCFGPLRSVRCGLGGRGVIVGERYSSDFRLAGGGILFEMGVHGLDTLLFCTETKIVKINSVRMILDGGFDLHTDAELVLSTGEGDRIDCNVRFSYLQDTINGWEFTFEHAVVSLPFSAEGVYVRPINGSLNYALSPEKGSFYPLTSYETFYEHWRCFLAGICTRQANRTSAARSILTTEVVERLYEEGMKSNVTEGT